MPFTPTDCSGTKCQNFLTIKFIQAQLVKLYINDFFEVPCLQINLRNWSILAAIVTL